MDMANMMNWMTAGMWSLGLIQIALFMVLVLGAAALVRYLVSRRSARENNRD